MLRLAFAVAVAALCGLLFGPAAFADPPTIYVENDSTLISNAQVAAAIPAFQTQVSRDLAPAWGVDARITNDPAEKKNAWAVMYLVDQATLQGALGYHDLAAGQPVAWIFAETAVEYSEDWRLTFSHELVEMLVDPWINRFAWWNKKQWLVEVGDPVESGQFAYWVDGTPLSDFILPRWYDPSLSGRFDFMGKVRRPGQVLKKGYASWKNPDGTWGQVFVGFSRFMVGETNGR